MKKSLLFVIIAMAGIIASAESLTKEQFIAKTKASSEKAGKEFDETKAAAVAAAFEERDLNKDGVLSDEEAAAAAEKKKTKKKKIIG